MTRNTTAVIGLIGLCLASTLSGMGNQFAQDDIAVIRENPVVHTLANPASFFTESYWPKPFAPALYRPLATTGFAVQWALGDGSPVVFRVVSTLLYAAAGLAVFALAKTILPFGAAWLVAAFFMVHPVHVEAVAVAVNQSELVVGWFAALTILLYLRLRQEHRLRFVDGLALFSLYLAATLFKESGLVIIGLIVAAELTLVRDPRPLRARLGEIRPLVLVMLLGATMFFAIRTFALGGDLVGTFTAEALEGLTMGGRAMTMVTVVPHWFRLLLWPAHLQADYSPREIEAALSWDAEHTQGALLLVLALGLAVICWKRFPVVTFGLMWTAIGIFPVSNVLVPTGIVLAERTLFLPSIGMMLVVGGLAAPAIEWLRRAKRPIQVASLIAVGAVLVMGTTRSLSRHLVWKNHFNLWYQTAIDAPLSFRAHHALAQLLVNAGAHEWAEQEYRLTVALYPKQWGASFEFADKLRIAGQCEEAATLYSRALVIQPEHDVGRASLIACLLYLGRYQEARDEAREGAAYSLSASQARAFRHFLRIADSVVVAKPPAGTVRLTVPMDRRSNGG